MSAIFSLTPVREPVPARRLVWRIDPTGCEFELEVDGQMRRLHTAAFPRTSPHEALTAALAKVEGSLRLLAIVAPDPWLLNDDGDLVLRTSTPIRRSEVWGTVGQHQAEPTVIMTMTPAEALLVTAGQATNPRRDLHGLPSQAVGTHPFALLSAGDRLDGAYAEPLGNGSYHVRPVSLANRFAPWPGLTGYQDLQEGWRTLVDNLARAHPRITEHGEWTLAGAGGSLPGLCAVYRAIREPTDPVLASGASVTWARKEGNRTAARAVTVSQLMIAAAVVQLIDEGATRVYLCGQLPDWMVASDLDRRLPRFIAALMGQRYTDQERLPQVTLVEKLHEDFHILNGATLLARQQPIRVPV
jgi:hypothetical protein